jgi:hypothetical protein
VSIFIPLLQEHDEPLNKRSATCDSPFLPVGHPSLVSLTLMIPPTRCKQTPKRLTMIRGTQTTFVCWSRPLFRKFENFQRHRLEITVIKSLG